MSKSVYCFYWIGNPQSLQMALSALLVFPLTLLTIVNPVAVSWSFRHGPQPMPRELLAKMYHLDRYFMTLRNLVLITAVGVLAAHQSIPAARLGLTWKDWAVNASLGFSLGLTKVCLQGIIQKVLPAVREAPNNPEVLRGTIRFWIAYFLLGSFGEELWIALCTVSLVSVLTSPLVAVLVVGSVFGLVHFGYGPGGVAAMAMFGCLSGSLFLWRGSLLPSLLFHFIGNIGVAYWARRQVAET